MTPKEKFVEMAKGITRPGIDEMMAWLEETDFYDAPASTKFHGSVPGGLCAHSITVAKRLLELADSMLPDCYSRDTLLTVALFHDVCKISTYKVYTRNAKNEATGSWEKVPFYKFEPEHNVGDMGVTAAANVNTVWDCYEKHPLSWLLHAADEAATALDKV